MVDKIVARPLITIANIIWSFNPQTHLPQILLVKRAYAPFKDRWALPETLLRSNESAKIACIRLIKDKIGVQLSNSATEQLQRHTLTANYPQFSLAYFGKNPQFHHLYLCNLPEITNFAVSKDGRFERAETVKIGGANPSKYGFVF